MKILKNISAISTCLGFSLTISCRDRVNESQVGNCKLTRINNQKQDNLPSKFLKFDTNGNFDGWFINSEGPYRGSGSWAISTTQDKRSVDLIFSMKDSAPSHFKKSLFWGDQLIDEWHREDEKVIYEFTR